MKNKYEVRGDVTAIIIISPKYGRLEALISTDKLERAKEFPNTWHVVYDKVGKTFYVRGNEPFHRKFKKSAYLHRWITNAPLEKVVDHINHNTLDNTDGNLRICTQAENIQNKKGASSTSRTGIRGVSWRKECEKWAAYIKVNGKMTHLGFFDSIEEAEQVAKSARAKYMPFSSDAINDSRQPCDITLPTPKRKKQKRSGVNGVYWIELNNKWMAKPIHNGKRRYLGLFETIADAEKSIQEALSS